jgi:hypothetical protein
LSIQKPDEAARELKDHWMGKEILLTKTEPTPEIRFTLQDARVVDWHEVNDPIRHGLPEHTRFVSLYGEGEKLYAVFIPLDRETVCDVRDTRMVFLTGKEVVQIRPVNQ